MEENMEATRMKNQLENQCKMDWKSLRKDGFESSTQDVDGGFVGYPCVDLSSLNTGPGKFKDTSTATGKGYVNMLKESCLMLCKASNGAVQVVHVCVAGRGYVREAGLPWCGEQWQHVAQTERGPL